LTAPHLTDAIVRLRLVEERDLAAYTAAFRDDADLGALLGLEQDPTEASLRPRLGREWVAPPDLRACEWVIADAASDAFRGTILLHSCDWTNRRAEVGFWIATGARRRGLLSAALTLVLDWSFAAGIERMEMTALPGNDAVASIARRFGFVYEGTLRQRNLERGRRVDLLMWGLLASDRKASAPPPR
jgi:RimJ/RimL family protein N-acetyltransferase